MKVKILSLFFCITTILFLFAGCSTPSSVGTVGDVEIPSGLYLMLQLNAYEQAAQKVEDSKKPILKQTVDETPAKDWIEEKTLQNVQRYAGILSLSQEMNITLAQSDETLIENTLENEWNYYEEYYTKNGIGKETLRAFLESEQKAILLLEQIYGVNGTEPVSEEELNKYIETNYSGISYFSLPLITSDYTIANDEQKEKIREVAKDSISQLEQGQDMETVAKESTKKVYELLGKDTSTIEDTTVQTSTISLPGNEESPLNKALFDTEVGGFGSSEDTSGFGITIFRRDSLTDPKQFASSALSSMKKDEFTQKLIDKGAEMGVNLNKSAQQALSVNNIKT